MNRKHIFASLILAAVFVLSLTFTGAVGAAPVSQHVTLTGYVSCTTCLLPNTCKAQTRLACTEHWIGQGASYVLVVGESHYRLSGFDQELAKAAAANSVTITGDLSDHGVIVSSVEINHKEK
jgi:hypothetical protein